MASIFTRIVKGEIPSYKVAEDDRHYAFLDINPKTPGHTLVIPKREVDYIFDLEPEELGELFKFAQKVADGIKKTYNCPKVGVAVIGLDVPHAHIHLVPLRENGDMDFSKTMQLPAAEMEHIAAEIAGNINKNEI